MTRTTDHKWWSLFTLAAGLAMIVLDGTIVGVALPTIIGDLHLDLAEAQWVNALYAVVFAALLMGFGRLGDLAGRRRLFIGGVVVFVIGSVIAALATSGASLIASRAVQGVGGAMVLPSSLSTVNATFRGRDRAAAFGVWGAVMAGTAAIGPLLGGWLVTMVSWQWIFWVNVPVGVGVVAAALAVVRETRGESDGRFDWLGLLLSVAGFGLLVFAIIEGPSVGWLRPTQDFALFGQIWPADFPVSVALAALLAGAGFVGAFLAWQAHRLRAGHSVILNLALFRIATFSWGNLTAMAVAVGEFALVFVLPLYLVGALGLSALGAGWVLAGMAAGAFLSGGMARHLSARFGAPRVVVLGLALEVLGVGLTATLLSPATSPVLIAVVLAVYGVGLGLASAQLTSTVLGDVPPERSGQASATQSTVRQIGSALGTAVAGSALSAGLGAFLSRRVADVPGLPAGQGAALVEATTASVGGNLSELSAQAAAGQLGPSGAQLVDALASGFSSASALAVWAAAGCLLLGLIGSLKVADAHRTRHAAEQPELQLSGRR
ncbi:MFS transporter [Tessaracoccus sp. OH4464_COT-324]|uniref:MFS transporter n=1 Tax=Tessaracoccus sp. OH4464_COT-324 TaxID=2491059 RepID=UPI000F62EE14|nr:MFS transporter [Tessaracoccus sp. OH4464_COT-324]RRD45693.1 DHA2 family efflux MFS transporter permease subunit [Tessaracoccus sp. OH4464_COT-324]